MKKLFILTLGLVLTSCASQSIKNTDTVTYYFFKNLPEIGESAAQQKFVLGGFSGLYFDGKNAQGNLTFVTHTDRGPNGPPIELAQSQKKYFTFAMGAYQPRIVRFELLSGEAVVTDQILLTQNDKALTGLPNMANKEGHSHQEEDFIDTKGDFLPKDPLGIDPEAITKVKDNYWLAEEYRPSLLKFNAQGKLQARYIPAHTSKLGNPSKEELSFLKEDLPEIYSTRQTNRGFEGLTIQNEKIYALLQSPLKSGEEHKNRWTRILEFNPKTEKTTAEYYYELENDGSDRVGDITSVGNGKFLVVEQNSKIGRKSIHKIYMITISKTNNFIKNKNAKPVEKKLIVDLVKLGIHFADKIEGIALIDNKTIAIINDNDFQMDGVFDLKSGLFKTNSDKKSFVAVIKLESLLF